MDYSILMSVYHKENPAYFKEAIESMLNQTVKSNDFVIVCDGPLTEELYEVLDFYEKDKKNCIHRLQLEKNQGLGIALQKGVLECNNELIARMDSDDIAIDNRIEMQLKVFNDNEIIICGGYVEEFNYTPGDLGIIKKVPLNNEDIIDYSKKRNPLNHMTVVFRKSKVLEAGNYINFKLFEDYYLWMRMIKKDYKFINLEKVLVNMRVGNGMSQRRGGVKYAITEIKIQNSFFDLGMITKKEKYRNILMRTFVRIMPNKIRSQIYRRLRRL